MRFSKTQISTFETKKVTVDGKLVPDARIITEQFVPMGPAASQIAIKQTGTNGGGFFGVNSAHPFENPNALTNLLEMLVAFNSHGALLFLRQGGQKQKAGYCNLLAMFLMLIALLSLIAVNEQSAATMLSPNNNVNMGMIDQAGGNMEGKETRFGITASSTWAAFTTAASNGSVNSMHDSYTPLGGLAQMPQMQIGEVIFGGVGCGLYGMLAFAILTVFIAGLMVGRTSGISGKKIEPREMKWAVLACLATPIAILAGSGTAAMVPEAMDSLNNGGAHGFPEMLYAYTSAGGNNGSAFAGFNANTVFLNVSIGLCHAVRTLSTHCRTLAIAGSLAEKKKKIAVTAGTLSTTNGMFIFCSSLSCCWWALLSFFPALALGPLASSSRHCIKEVS